MTSMASATGRQLMTPGDTDCPEKLSADRPDRRSGAGQRAG
jgi:hypothetical protein